MAEQEHHVDPTGLVRGGEGAITGTVVCAAAIAYGAGHLDTVGQLCVAIVGTVLVYWLAHLHAVTIGAALSHRTHPFAAFRFALVETLPILFVSFVPLVVLLLAEVLGADLSGAGWAALGATIALLAVYSWVACARGGLDLRGRLLGATAGALLGVLVALLKVALH
ncbi:hypothetical protein [Luteimicrobium subarcticum]|uniref:Uncharacterized protein n=1 Tax=Luteimicrobium subarcticum TaxID=620910 RepID=A0A2M8WUW8_9MICO|nr:hypothetical protein [Luteimicrobium subarcticum]PJI94737.1 hypothetical protein CLV34_0583 [Luteimicrobium subarcticum]